MTKCAWLSQRALCIVGLAAAPQEATHSPNSYRHDRACIVVCRTLHYAVRCRRPRRQLFVGSLKAILLNKVEVQSLDGPEMVEDGGYPIVVCGCLIQHIFINQS